MKVVFFPRNDYPNNVEICTHRLGKKVTFCECTTTLPPLVAEKMLPYVVSLNATSNIRVTGFIDQRDNLVDYVYEQIAAGVIVPDVYFLPIPTNDYSEAATMEGKRVRWQWYENTFGKKPMALIFGQTASLYGDYMKPYVLAGQSGLLSEDTDYGVGVGNPNNVPYSINRNYMRDVNRRSLDYAILHDENYAGYIDWTASFIDSTLALPKGGLILSFCHWHNVLALDYNSDGTPKEGRNDYAIENGFKPYFDMLAQKNANDEIYFAGYGEAFAYLVYRECISKMVMYSPIGAENDKLVIRLEAKNVFNIDTDLLQIPISVKFSTVGTPLQGYQIQSTNNLISLGNNQYIVEIPYSEYAGAVIEKVD